MNPIDQQKKRLRKELRSAGRNLEETYRKQASARICTSIRQILDPLPPGRKIASFLALADEPELTELIASEAQFDWLLPKIEGADGMDFYQVSASSLDQLVPAKFGLLEPDPRHHPKIQPEQISAILIPASGLTRKGHRLGKGGGFYDRFLPKLSASTPKVGVVYETQIRPQLPTDAHDCRVDWVVTEDQLSRVIF